MLATGGGRESFLKSMTPSKLTMFQWKIALPRTLGKHKLVLEDSKQGDPQNWVSRKGKWKVNRNQICYMMNFLNEFKKPHMSVSDRSVQFLYRVYYFASVALLSMATFKGRSDPTAS